MRLLKQFNLRAIAFLVAMLLMVPMVTQAQSDPTPVIDAVIRDLGNKIGIPMDRATINGTYAFEEIVLGDNTNLGCPGTVQQVQNQRTAWKITLTLNGRGNYDYRATIDGKYFFLCATTDPTVSLLTATATPQTPPPLVVPTIGVAPITGQAVSTTFTQPVLAYVGVDSNLYISSPGANILPLQITYDSGGTRNPIYFDAKVGYGQLKWSPDGNSLAFIRFGDNLGSVVGDIYVMNNGAAPVKVASNVQPDLGIIWSPDGNEIGYAVKAGEPDASFKVLYQVQAVPRTGGQPRAIGSLFMQNFAEGGPYEDPADALLLGEQVNIFNATSSAWTSTGIVHAVNGLFNSGLALTNFAGQDVWVQAGVNRAVISPDRTRAVAILDNQGGVSVALIDLATGSVQSLVTVPRIDSLGWSLDGLTVFYSTADEISSLPADMTKSVAISLFSNQMPPVARTYNVTVWGIFVTGGTPTALATAQGRAVASIFQASPNQVNFTFISSSLQMIQLANANDPNASGAYPKIQLGTLIQGKAATLTTDEIRHPAASKAASFTAVSNPTQVSAPVIAASGSSCPGLLPSRMVIGKQGRVLPGDPNNLNTLPAPPSKEPTSKNIGIIQPGAVFTVMSGPVCAFNYAWFEVNYNGSVGWTAESGNGQYWIEPIG